MKVKLRNFRLSVDADRVLSEETERTGKTMTQVIEDFLLWQRLFSEEAESVLREFAERHALPKKKIIEVAILKLKGGEKGRLPFNRPTVSLTA